MSRRNLRLLVLIPWVAGLAGAAAREDSGDLPRLHHDLEVVISPAAHRLEVEDRISFPEAPPRAGALRFVLNAGLEVESPDPAYRVEALPGTPRPGDAALRAEDGGIPREALREYRLLPARGAWPPDPRPRLRVRGEIHQPPVPEGEEYARSFSRSSGTIEEQGVVLSGSSFWLPWFGEESVTFRLTVTLPADWDAVSQGERTLHVREGGARRVRWEATRPAEEVHLVAGRFTEYTRSSGRVHAYAFLRRSDPDLAARYLEATLNDIAMYSRLIGPYPYRKFALVENFWETGYGMPSFTLLGPRVIRLPFLLRSSYPHEILHGWWGNSVFVDATRGNWSEGLTAYLADHLMQEAAGKGSAYRRDTLIRYRAAVRGEKEFPLVEFRSRHSSASESIGYGKSMMLWHMLRLRLGDRGFVEGLQRLYRDHRFRRASFDDLIRVFSEAAGEDLGLFFRQWIERTGAPQLALHAERLDGNRIRVRVRQVQPGEPYDLAVPLAVTLAGEPAARIFSLRCAEPETRVELSLTGTPVRVDLDPLFDVFRRLDREETPPTLGDLFGAAAVMLVLPRDESALLGRAWRDLARAWSGRTAGQVVVVDEQDLEQLPADRAVWVLGSGNRWRRPLLPALEHRAAGPEGDRIRIGESTLSAAGHAFVYVVRHPRNPDLSAAWVGADRPPAIAGLARKLPHYGKYSYLAFSGDEPVNRVEGQWPPLDSPLTRVLAPRGSAGSVPAAGGRLPPRGTIPEHEPLARPGPSFDPLRLMAHVERLAADRMEGRGVGTRGLEEAGEYIAGELRAAGLVPAGDDGSYLQTWTEPGGPGGDPVTLRNVVGVLPGRRPGWESQSVVLGAHYDHLGRGWPDARASRRGEIYNGADDNASGVAVLLELARRLAGEIQPERSMVFVAFSGEEWGRKGSRHYVRAGGSRPAHQAIAMINLDTVGRLEGKPVLVLGAASAREWIPLVTGAASATGVEVRPVAGDPGGSDQVSFQEIGVPAVQILGGAHAEYHQPEDDVDRIDARGMARVARLVRELLLSLAARDRPLTPKPAGGSAPAPTEPERERRVSLGTVPDFAYPGPGVRAASILGGSPAESAGLRAGDVLVAIDGLPILDLRGYADLLRSHAPGDRIRVRIRRGGREMVLGVTLGAR